MYEGLIRPLLFRLPPETAHQLTLRVIGLAGKYPPFRELLKSRYNAKKTQPVTISGLIFPNQVGLAAGYDKDAQAILGLSTLGFGHIEIGTITPLPQTGNPKPRVFRLKKDYGIINRMGFPGKGADYCFNSLAKQTPVPIILGINIGKNRDTPIDQSTNDYTILIEKLSIYADYFAINISSPNTVGLRDLQNREHLGSLLSEIKKVRDQQSQIHRKPIPLVVKLSPDMELNQLDQALEAILANQIDGIIATNTTISREYLVSTSALETGGLSGKPLSQLNTRVIAHIHRQTGGKIPIIGVGGISSPEDAQQKIDAGASLVQIYTGLVYHGPLLVRRIVEGLSTT